MSFRSRFRRQQQQQQPTAAVYANKKNNKRDSISRFLRNGTTSSSSSSSSMMQQSPLAPFDACIEACDALAASSSSVSSTTARLFTQNQQIKRIGEEAEAASINNDDTNGSTTNMNSGGVISDCSVLVSPDGALLFTTPQTNDTDLCNNNTNHDNNNNKYPWTNISNENRDGVILNDEYESAIICGNDLHPTGDYASNGFTARGWDCDAATAALRSSCEVLNMMERFVIVVGGGSDTNNKYHGSSQRRRGGNKHNSSNSNNKHNRVGPLLSSGTDLGTNISVALETMEEYFSTLAETDSQHWRDVCLESTSTSTTTRNTHADDCTKNKIVGGEEGRADTTAAAGFMSEQRQTSLLDRNESEPEISSDIWELVNGVAAMEDFGHTGYSPRVTPKVSVADDNDMIMTTTMTPPNRQINRSDIERESEIQDIRMVAMAADESVEDASSQLLNIMSKQDTTMRSARVASESCLLSECNAVHNCLRSLVAIEPSSGWLFSYWDDDDGGVAAALAVLNSHVEGSSDSMPHPNIERPNHFEGWGAADNDAENDDTDDVEPEVFGEVINLLFDRDQGKSALAGPDSPRRGKRERTLSESYKLEKEEKVALAAAALEEKTKRGQSFRQTILYELNNQRSKKQKSKERLILKAIDVSNAKMAMILSQTFYYIDRHDDNSVDDRESRVYVKNTISHHSIWSDDEFWDHALEQCVAESLQKSGVLLNYVKSSVDVRAVPNKCIKWHDLAPSEYADAAAQVHSVVFAQLGTLAHSMLEMDVSGSGSTARASTPQLANYAPQSFTE
ncbi:hypothetical protein QTG54_012957 [Skeletonema marinoi]|uniref:Uncharacterized protein n=1 Tax=Skeletonema marinoi TaxID=267567 RepID=A0AAD8XZM4_9STRA|nr:hypothetical protein QTG54_012957 [Skeletonema marinoi]